MESTEDLYEDAPFGYLSALDDGSIVRVNNTFLQLSGYTRDEILATTFTALLTTGSQLFYQTRLLPVLHLQGAVSEVALTLRHADTTDVPVLVNSSLVEASATSPRITRTAFLGSSERREYERDLLAAQRSAETSERRVRILQDASNAFGVCTTKEELATALTLTVRDAFAASEAALLLADDSGTLHSIAGDHPLSAVMPAFVHGPELDAFSTGEIVTVSDIRTADELYPHWSAALVSTRLEAVSAVPVLGDAGATLGVLVCFFARSHEFSPQEIELHSALARQAALVLVRIRLQRQLEHLALHDQLTGLANRQLLSERLEPALEREGDLRRPLAVIVIDLDGFKAINDGFGHATGDLVLRQVALRMESVVRGTDLAGRIGGDEFVIICDDADERVAAAIAGRVRDAIASPLDGFETALPLTASIGVAVHAADGVTRVTGKAMFEAADSAMYRSKNAGKNAVSVTRV
jgi:diguanylate cyclase (GGDEF)-like protein/PAS domain S-box-containing protein